MILKALNTIQSYIHSYSRVKTHGKLSWIPTNDIYRSDVYLHILMIIELETKLQNKIHQN